MDYIIALCDDDIEYMAELEKLLKKCIQPEDTLEILKYTSGEQILNANIDEADAIFLDIQLHGMDGNEISIELRKRGYRGVLIHCSGIYMPTPETIKISPFRYLVKQSEKDEIMKDLRDIFDEIARRKEVDQIEAYYMREKIMVLVADIMYITHHRNGKSVLHLKESLQKTYVDGKVITPYSFKELMNMLKKSDFAMPHSSYIINLHYVTGIIKSDFMEMGSKRLSISRAKKNDFFKQLLAYSRNKYKRKD